MTLSLTDIGVGTVAGDGTGDTARAAGQTINANNALIAAAVDLNTAKLTNVPVATDPIWDAAGDLAVGTGANTAAKLSKGTALQVLRVNAGATALEWAAAASGTPEGTAILSTGETGGSKFLREDGDDSCSWQAIPAVEGTAILSTGPVTDGYVLTADGAGAAAWEAAAGGGLSNVVEDTTPQLGGNLDLNSKQIIAAASTDAVVKLADNAGGYSLSIHDSDDAEVAYLDSDGMIFAANFRANGGKFYPHQTLTTCHVKNNPYDGNMLDLVGNGATVTVNNGFATNTMALGINTIYSGIADAAGVVGLTFASKALSTAGTKIASFKNNTTEKLAIMLDGKIEADKTTADSAFINFKATADSDATSAISTLTTSGSTTHHIQVEINGVTAWIACSTTDPS